MLALVTIFLATLLISAFAVWVYRKISGWKGFSQSVVERKQATIRMELKPQQGFISLIAPLRGQKAKSVRLRNSTGTIKAPWGW
jgi:hypothetical protein